MKRATILFGITLTLALALAIPRPGVAQGGNVTLIRDATILTISRGIIENGSVLLRDGKIAEIGTSLSAPAGATVIDAKGMFLMPGIIDCHSHIAIDGGVNEGSISVSSMVDIKDVINADDIDIYRDLAGGVTAANVLHGSANAIGGKTVVIKLRWGQPANKLPFEGALPGIKFALGENPKRTNQNVLPGVPRRYPDTRMGVEDVIREAFKEAKEYMKDWDEYNRRKSAGEANLIPPRRDLQLDALVEVLQGKRYVHSHCYRADEIMMLMHVADEFGFKVRTFQHVLEGYKVAKEMAAHGAGGSTFSDWWSYKAEAYDAIPYNAALMTKAGVVVSINSDNAGEARHLNLEAAKSMKYGGLTELECLKMVTLNPAIQLGIDNRVGTIDKGKDADLVLYNKHPLSVYSVPQRVWIDGHEYFNRDNDIAMRPKLEEEKKALMEKEKAAQPGKQPGKQGGPRRPGQTGESN
jgi:imidazolonepropionase-like amidohydrolase